MPTNIEAILTGKYSMNVYFKDVFLSSPHKRLPTSVKPLLEMPGTNEIAWNIPMINASLYVISLSFFLPLQFITNIRDSAVIKKPNPTKKTSRIF